jgi:hypothetical protein
MEIWPFTTSLAGNTYHDPLRQQMSVCGVIRRGGTAIACKSRNTKLPELAFHAILSDGAQEMRFEHLAVR